MNVPEPWEVVQEAQAPFLVADLMLHAGLVPSKAEARRVIAQGGAYVNGERVADAGRVLTGADVRDGRFVALRRGKRHAALIEVLPSPEALEEAAADLVLVPVVRAEEAA